MTVALFSAFIAKWTNTKPQNQLWFEILYNFEAISKYLRHRPKWLWA